MSKKNSNKNSTKSMRCRYCGSPVVLRSADGIYNTNTFDRKLYVCSRYPACDAYARQDKSGQPMGLLANNKLRFLRHEAHRFFDTIHTSGIMNKDHAYRWLSTIVLAPRGQAHIANLDEYYCLEIIKTSKKMLEAHGKKIPPARDYSANIAAKGG